MNIEKRIYLCQDMTPVESQIARFILKHRKEIENMTIQELADAIPVSKSAIHRFCKKIDLNGFNDLKVQIAKDNYSIINKNTFINVNYPFQKEDDVKNIAFKMIELYELTIRDTLGYINYDDIEKIVVLMNNCSIIDIYTHSHNLNAAENFQDKMLTVGKMVNVPKTKYKQRLTVLSSDKTHLAIILSYSGKATFIEQIVKKLYEKQIPIVLISQVGKNNYPHYIKYSLGLTDKENMQERISQFSSHIAMQYMLDVIYAAFFNLNRNKNINYIKEHIDYMDDRELD
ncbi:MurR/RpiR family transcriptional regulator [Thomasclavelia sp.]|uniref:MurR/RpiR family transcriptional regulator n=1 Tax=Thomasclavelia sp. TaxID=3025757 RepID=UPI0025FCE4B3|nr:MurR/RpiR family transcriptional regulator [Thomasclavelia sp.]